MADGSNGDPSGRTERSSGAKRRALANEGRLAALGDAVDRQSGKVPKRRRRRRRGRTWLIAGVAVIVLIGGVLGGGYLYANWRFDEIPKINVKNISYPVPGQPFNILAIGSDSRAGLTGAVARQTGASSGSVSGQRSDVIKIIHINPTAGTITILSIPRDTAVTLLANQSLFGKFNRINVNYQNGPSLLVQTIEANFGIPINHVIQVNFSGLINSAVAIGGVYLDFRYPARDPYSGLKITHTGCQLVDGFQALAVARSRHYYYAPSGNPPWPSDAMSIINAGGTPAGWVYDGTSDFGRIDRQTSFLRAMFSRVKSKLDDPFAINGFLSNLPKGITLDSTFSLNEIIGLALKFHGYNSGSMLTYTLPEVPGVVNGADLEFVDQPYAQQMLVNIFGNTLKTVTNPPPNTALQTPPPPVITPTTTTTGPATTSKHHHVPTTTTTNPTLALPIFDPVPCTPG
ncbi:MAG: LCP family protein [Acidimicrobiales bacterium]|jgi:LCP family protein required for cell wall assembly